MPIVANITRIFILKEVGFLKARRRILLVVEDDAMGVGKAR